MSDKLRNVLEKHTFEHNNNPESAKVRIISCAASLENSTNAYNSIHKVENLFRKLICLVFYPTETMDWLDIYIPREIKGKITKRKGQSNGKTDISIYDTDFGDALSIIMKQPPHETLLNDLRGIVKNYQQDDSNNGNFNKVKELIDNSYPTSLWDKKKLNEVQELRGLKTQWEKLEPYRNKIAHNKIITTNELDAINGLSRALIETLTVVIEKFSLCQTSEVAESSNQIDITEEEIINRYELTNSIALSNFDDIEIDDLQYWFFNTNESNAPNAYKEMFKENDGGLVSIYGYGSPAKFNGAKKGQKVLAYVNKKGILAAGTIEDNSPFRSNDVFKKYNDEFSLKVKWEKILPEGNGITLKEATKMGYPLPVRSTFCKLYNSEIAKELYNKVINRDPPFPEELE